MNTEYTITDWQDCLADNIVNRVWLVFPEHIDDIFIYQSRYYLHKQILKSFLKNNIKMVHWQKDMIAALLYTNIALQMKICTIPYDQGFTHLFG